MKVMIVTSSPNKDGLTAACGMSAKTGCMEGGAEITMISLNDFNISSCHACSNAWGTCASDHECQVQDGFQKLHKMMETMDAFIVITPVYWGDMSESAKSFFDRLRRCEAAGKPISIMEGKPVISVAAAGGSGNGTLSCLTQMERLFSHLRAEKFDFISITRKSRDFKLDTIRSSSREMINWMSKQK
jgi:multimeric flavodoxin WrbA